MSEEKILTTGIPSQEEQKTKRAYHRRTPEEIAADKAAKEEKKRAKAASKDDDKPTTKRKKAGNGQAPVMQKRGQWSDPNASMVFEKMFVEIELLENALGTWPNNKQLLREYIASNAPDRASMEEEITALGEEAIEKKQTTVFPRGFFIKGDSRYIDIIDKREGYGKVSRQDLEEKGIRLPFIFDYQLRGMFKDTCGLLARGSYGESATISAYKKVIDGGIFVYPRRVAWDLSDIYYDDAEMDFLDLDPDNLPIVQRPLRISGPSGERSAIASSEMIPAGSSIKFCIMYADPKMKDTIIEWLNYGAVHGIGGWRNSGLGIFKWRELNPDYSIIEGEED